MQYTNCLCIICKNPKFLKIIKKEHQCLSYAICLGKYLFGFSFNLKLLKYLLKKKPLLFVSFCMVFNLYYVNASKILRWICQLLPNTFCFILKGKVYGVINFQLGFYQKNRIEQYRFYQKKNRTAKYI